MTQFNQVHDESEREGDSTGYARVFVDGTPYALRAGSSLLDALLELGVEVPHLCHDPRLPPAGACRLCVVEVGEAGTAVAACTTRIQGDMVVRTRTPALETRRRAVLESLAQRYPKDADPSSDTPLDRYFADYRVVPGGVSNIPVDDAHPYIRVDMSRCIDCFRCIRICDHVQGQFVWSARGRSEHLRIVPDSGTTLRASSCVSCGACVDTCPSGALQDRSILTLGQPTEWTRTTCPYCGTGCEMSVGTRAGRLVAVRPVLDAPVSRGHLCVKGRYAFDFVHATDRVTEPMIREADGWRRASWSEAIAFVARSLERIRSAHGPDSIGVLGSARATNEENYVAQKLARVVLGTNNVDCCARVCHAPSAAALGALLGTGAATNSFSDIELAKGFLICGANPTENHPIVGARIKQAVLGGAPLIVIDPRSIELARYATHHLRVRPGWNVPLLHALAHVIIEEALYDPAFVRDRVDGLDDLRELVTEFAPERVEGECGVSASAIVAAARLYASVGPVMAFHGLGVTEHVQGADGVSCLVNLALLTGNIGRRGAGVNPLRGQNNVQGAAHMGCEPDHLTGYADRESARERFESAWGTALPGGRGLNLMRMMDAARAGTLKALWAIGYDILLTNPNAAATEEALGRLELVVAQDLFMNETARQFAHVFLPASSSFEKDGTFMNSERRIQRVRRAIEPRGASKSDWEILCEVARAMGHADAFRFSSAEEVWNEIRSVWPAGAGITYGRLEQGGLQWPCPDERHPGTEMLHERRFSSGERARLALVPFLPTAERTSDEYPFLLITGRTLHQFNAGTMTLRTRNTELRAGDFLDVSPEDAARLGITQGREVTVRSRYGSAALPVAITSAMRPGELFATFHTASVFLNRLTSPSRDRRVDTPEYKVTAVRLEPF